MDDDDIDIIAHADFSFLFVLCISIHPLFPRIPLGYQNRWRLIVSRGRRRAEITSSFTSRRLSSFGDLNRRRSREHAIALTTQQQGRRSVAARKSVWIRGALRAGRAPRYHSKESLCPRLAACNTLNTKWVPWRSAAPIGVPIYVSHPMN